MSVYVHNTDGARYLGVINAMVQFGEISTIAKLCDHEQGILLRDKCDAELLNVLVTAPQPMVLCMLIYYRVRLGHVPAVLFML